MIISILQHSTSSPCVEDFLASTDTPSLSAKHIHLFQASTNTSPSCAWRSSRRNSMSFPNLCPGSSPNLPLSSRRYPVKSSTNMLPSLGTKINTWQYNPIYIKMTYPLKYIYLPAFTPQTPASPQETTTKAPPILSQLLPDLLKISWPRLTPQTTESSTALTETYKNMNKDRSNLAFGT